MHAVATALSRRAATTRRPDPPSQGLRRGKQSGAATTLDTNSSVDDKTMTAQPHLLLASEPAALADDEAPKASVSRRPIHLTL